MSGVHESPSDPQFGAVEAKPISAFQQRSVHDPPKFHNGISVLEYPFPRGLTYIFSWSDEYKLLYSVGNVIQGGSDRYTTQTVSVSHKSGYYENNNVTISNHKKNAPLASARTSDGNIHLFYSDNSNDDRILSELIFDPNGSTWTFGSLTALRLKVHEHSGIGAWSEPILKVVIHASGGGGAITEAWWDTVDRKWKSFVVR